VQKVHLLDLAENISSWAELETRISNLPSKAEKGEIFEEFCKAFFLLDPVFQFEKVYLQNKIPPSFRQKLGYPLIQDIGIDGLAVTFDGKVVAYQAKFRSDRNNIPTLRELSTFFTVSDKADWRITITNANSLPAAINDRVRSSRVLADRFDQLDPEFFDRLRLYLKEQYIKPPSIKSPHKTQQEAIERALDYFKEQDRGQLILPCGTGKTLAAMWVAEKIGGSRILVMVPSLALMSQTLREWAVNTSIKPFHYLCLCSDPTVDLGNDSPIEHLYEMDVPVTTDVAEVSNFLLNERHVISILFSTYQSSKVLSEAVLKTNTVFDVGIFDEAHRTTGTKVGVWNIALGDKNVPVKKRIFMTATPRIYAPHIIKKAKEEDILICSMDDPKVYGTPFYEMTFGKAIEEKLITDYKVVVICVTDSEVKEIIQRGGKVITDEHEWDAKAFAKRVALVKGVQAYGLKKVFTFHGRVKGAKAFTDTNTPYGIHQVFKMLLPENSPLERGVGVCTTPPSMGDETGRVNDPSSDKIKFFHVNGTMSSGLRSSLLKEFENSEISIMSNARCLTEGVDVPAVDTVAFIDPKKSLIDIVQATGRAMRKADWKEKGYIFIPVVIEENSDPEKIIESSDFDTVWQVLQSMIDQDQRLQDIVSNLRIMQGKGEENTQVWKNAMSEYSEKVEFYNLPIKIDKTRFINTLYTKTIEVVGKSWDFWYGLTLKYMKQFGEPYAPQNYKTPDGYPLGRWQHTQRQLYRKGSMLSERIKKFEGLGYDWYRYDKLLEEKFGKGIQETIKYKNISGTSHAPYEYITPEGFRLGQWQTDIRQFYKKGNLASERIKKLEEIGFKWYRYEELLNESFEHGFRETLRYKNQYGNPNAPSGTYTTPEGFKLGVWQNDLRRSYKKGTLVAERINRLNEIGFKWDLKKETIEKAFERGFQETLSYKKIFGDPNAAGEYITPEGYRLGQWQINIRQKHKKGKLDLDEFKRLEEIGFKWEFREEAFEKGFTETLKYHAHFGNPNAHHSYKTTKGYRLGGWQTEQRTKYKKGKLSPERIKRLEEIGFKWESKKREK
jgi:superfamily II DNA or RNA helicase